jgi:outer membrane lipoprotein carrier protein
MIRRMSVLLIWGAVLSGLLRAAEPVPAAPAAAAVLSRMAEAEKAVVTLRFSFTQTTFVKMTGEKVVSLGKAQFRRPDRFRVEHFSPRPMTAVSDGKTMWVYNPARRQVLVDRWKNWAVSAGFPRGLGLLQEEAGDLGKKYNAVLSSRTATADALVLTPRAPEASKNASVRAWVDRASGLPLRTELEFPSFRTMTEVSNLEINPDLPDEAFQFKTPAGVEEFHSDEGKPTP